MLRPFFPFYGSKWNIARHYPAPRGHVVEPFCGAAGYSTFYGVNRATLYDKDEIVIGTWQFILQATEHDILSLPLLSEVGDSVDNYSIPQEAKWLIGFWLNRGSASPKKSRTAYSARTDRAQLNWGERAKRRIAAQLPAVKNWTAKQGDFSDAVSGDTTFVDPPYVDKGKFYRVKFDEHARLATWCAQRTGRVVVCEGPGATWLPFEPLGSFKSSKGRAEEFVAWRDV